MADWKGRLFFLTFGALVAAVGYLLHHWGEPIGILIGLVGGACIAVSTVFSDRLFEKTIGFMARFW